MYSINFIYNVIFSLVFALFISGVMFVFDVTLHYYSVIFILLSLFITFFSYKVALKAGLGFSDPALILSGFLTLYTMSPLIQNFMGVKIFLINSIYDYSSLEIFYHSVRFLVFNFLICALYFVFSDVANRNRIFREIEFKFNVNCGRFDNGKVALILAALILFLSVAALIAFAAPVNTYYDNYSKYDHLPGHLRTVVSIFKRLYWGVMPILVVLLLINFKSKKIMVFTLALLLCVVDLVISKGSRINTFIILVQLIVVYNILVEKISLRKAALIVFPLIMIMSLIELLRLSSGDVNIQDMALIPGEFNALFFPSIELFKMREFNEFPPVSDLMLFKDVYYILPFVNNPEADPMDWYWHNFHPNAPVAPFTMGPVADSAFFGGWLALILRSVVLAVNLFILRSLIMRFNHSWIALLIFSYSVSISILALKYSVFSFHEQLIKNLVPTIILFLILCFILRVILGNIKFTRVK